MLLDILPDNQDVNYKITINSVTPRPIAWVSTTSHEGINNLAPFSFFAPLCTSPLIFSISISLKSDGSQKDTLINAKRTRKLTISTVQREFLESMKQSSEELAHNISEFDTYGIKSSIVDSNYPPMVVGSKVAFFCEFREIIYFGVNVATLIIEAKKAFIDDSIYQENLKFSMDNIGRVGRSFI